MNCPVCKNIDLISTELEFNLPTQTCPGCGGNWIRGTQYWSWLEKQDPNAPERAEELASDDSGLSLAEPAAYIDCPECRFRMVKYLVGQGLTFNLDHCEGCKGIWLDKNEWETLKKHKLHDDLNSMLTSFWQARARKEARMRHMEQIYINRFGSDVYAEIRKIRSWLDNNENKLELLAYLTDKDPFDV